MATVDHAAYPSYPNTHTSPCPELVSLRDRLRDAEGSINDEAREISAHSQALSNNLRQMDRIEARVGELHGRMDREQLLLMGALASGVVTMIATLFRVAGH